MGYRTLWSPEDEAMQEANFLAAFRRRCVPCPPFFQGTFQAALEHARSRDQMLLMYLHCDTHQDTDTFCRSTLMSASLITFTQNNVVPWFGNVRHADAYRLCSFVGATSFPVVAMLAPGVGRHPTLVFRHSGLIDPEALVALAASRMQVQGDMTRRHRAQETERNSARVLRAQQDAEFERALKVEQQKREVEALARAAAEVLQEEERRSSAAAAAQLKRMQHRRTALATELDTLRESLPPAPDVLPTTVQLRLPGGRKVQRSFHKEHKLKVVLDFVRCEVPLDVHLENCKYQVVSLHPRRVWSDGEVRLNEMKLGRRLLLIVEYLDDTDEDTEAERACGDGGEADWSESDEEAAS